MCTVVMSGMATGVIVLNLPDTAVSRTINCLQKLLYFCSLWQPNFLKDSSLVPVALWLERNRSFICLLVPN